MQTADREEFERLVGTLCAGYNKPVTEVRTSAYWTGLAKMSIAAFSRCVDFALSEEGPDELPAAKGIWKIYRRLRAPPPAVRTSARGDDRDHLEYWANRLLYVHTVARGGLGSVAGAPSAELVACLKLKRELVDWYLGPIREGDPIATPAEFMQQWIAGLQAISRIDKTVYARWCAMLDEPEFTRPFEPYMARELDPQQAAA